MGTRAVTRAVTRVVIRAREGITAAGYMRVVSMSFVCIRDMKRRGVVEGNTAYDDRE